MKLLGVLAVCETQNNVVSNSVSLSPFVDFSCPRAALFFVFLSGKWLNTPSLLSALSVFFSSLPFSQHGEDKDYPSSVFPLDREWAAFELLLTVKPLLTYKLFMRHQWLRHMGWPANRVMSEIDKRRSGGREGSGSEGRDKTRASALEVVNWHAQVCELQWKLNMRCCRYLLHLFLAIHDISWNKPVLHSWKKEQEVES